LGCGSGTFSGAVDAGIVGTICEIVVFAVWEFGFVVDTSGVPGAAAAEVSSVFAGRGSDCKAGAGGAIVGCVGVLDKDAGAG